MAITNDPQYFIGIDIGTGSTKAVAISVSGTVLGGAQLFYTTQSPRPGYSEQDPETVWRAFLDCIRKTVEKVGRPPVAVSLSSAMHGLMVINDQNKPVTFLITWADTRSEKVAEKLHSSAGAESLYNATGTPIHAMTPLCKIVWLREKNPAVFHEAYKFISIKEYIWYKLFGVYEIDHSVASATGLFNIHLRQWNEPSLQWCRITADRLSQPVPTDFIRTGLAVELAAQLNLPAETVFCIGGSDGCMANLGSYAIRPGTASLTIGTSGAVRIASPKPVSNFREMTFSYVMDRETFICGGPVNNGGNTLLWLFRSLLKIDKPTELDYAALFNEIDAVPPGSLGLLFLPYLHGERAPVWDGRSSGVFAGIRSYHTRECFLRAVLEGICLSLYQVMLAVEASTEPIGKLIVGGGFIHSHTWMKMLSDITGKNIYVIETEDSSAVGAALLAMKALNRISDYGAFEPRVQSAVTPDETVHQQYNRYFSVFKELYPALVNAMHRLSENNG